MSWRVVQGDCIEVMSELDEASVDAIVTDPPYGLEFMGKEWDRLTRNAMTPASVADAEWNATHPQQDEPGTKSGMARRMRDRPDLGGSLKYAAAMQAWHQAWATEALRVLKPGGHLLAFGGTRTYHRLACALEDAGFEIRDCLAYLYGSGFPKSLNLKGCQCQEGESTHGDGDLRGVPDAVPDARGVAQAGEGATLQPALQWQSEAAGVGAARAQGSSGVDAAKRGVVPSEDGRPEQPSVEGRRDAEASQGQLQGRAVRPVPGVGAADGSQGRLHHGASASDGADVRSALVSDGSGEPHRPQPVEQRPEQPGAVADERGPQTRGGWPLCPRCGKPRITRGLGTALKPAYEPIVLARKPLAGTVAQNVTQFGTGALNIDGTRIDYASGTDQASAIPQGRATAKSGALAGGTQHDGDRSEFKADNTKGRWPANIALDDEAASLVGPEARFFKVVRPDIYTEDSQWPTQQSPANTAASPSSQPSASDGSAPSDAATSALLGTITSNPEPSTTATASASKPSDERDTPATHNTEPKSSPASPPRKRTRSSSPANGADQSEPTDTTTTTADPSTSVGSAVAAISSITPSLPVPGAAASPADIRRQFYTSKASTAERNKGTEYMPKKPSGKMGGGEFINGNGTPTSELKFANHHPTVKPVDLMQWLCRLITPKGGTVLDPFTGSGSTGIAALREGFSFVGIEREAEYVEIARARIIGDAPLLNTAEEVGA